MQEAAVQVEADSSVGGKARVQVPGTRGAMANVVPLARFVLVPIAARATGYTERAIHKKIDDGVWRRGREWRKAPDGRRLIDLQAVEAWVASSS